MHQRKLAAKPQAKNTPTHPKRKRKQKCPDCGGEKDYHAEVCLECSCRRRRPPIDANAYMINGIKFGKFAFLNPV